MRIQAGCELIFELPQSAPMIAALNVHFSRFSDLECPDHLLTNPAVPVEGYRDSFGNWCNRLVAPAGRFSLGTNTAVRDSGASDPVDLSALQHQVQHLPAETFQFRFTKLGKRGKEQLKSYEGHALKEAPLMSPLPHDSDPIGKLAYP